MEVGPSNPKNPTQLRSQRTVTLRDSPISRTSRRPRGKVDFHPNYGSPSSGTPPWDDFRRHPLRNVQEEEESIHSSEVQDVFRYSSPERRTSPSPSPVLRANYRTFSSPRGHRFKREVAAPAGRFVSDVDFRGRSFLRGVHSAPGNPKTGDVQRFRRFGSKINWITDEYTKHKQHGPGYYGSP